jgi:hypothetical protein
MELADIGGDKYFTANIVAPSYLLALANKQHK